MPFLIKAIHRKAIDHKALAEAFLECRSLISQATAALHIPAPMVEYAAKPPSYDKRTYGLYNAAKQTITLNLVENASPDTLRETAYHEFGHYVDRVLTKGSFGTHYWPEFIGRWARPPRLNTDNVNRNGEEDMADAFMLYFCIPNQQQQLARIGFARQAAIKAIFAYRANTGPGTADDPYAVGDAHSLLLFVQDQIQRAYLQYHSKQQQQQP